MRKRLSRNLSLQESELLKVCPWCGYSLLGLPLEHRCPECGQLIDRRWEVFGGKSQWHFIGISHRVFAILTESAFLLFLIYFWKDEFNLFYGIVLAFMILMWLWTYLKRPSMFVAVGPDGLVAGKFKEQTLEKFGWDRLGEAHRAGYVNIDGADTSFEAWGHTSEAKRFTEYINDYLDELKNGGWNPD